MKITLISIFATALFLFSCTPPTETRAHMDNIGDRMSDSIIKYIDSALTQPGREMAGTGSPIASAAGSFTPVALPK